MAPEFPPKAPESAEQQERDAQMIYRQIMSGEFGTYNQVEQVVAQVYVPDRSLSRAGINRALEMLKHHYSQPRSEK